jgi:hypothetical protein
MCTHYWQTGADAGVMDHSLDGSPSQPAQRSTHSQEHPAASIRTSAAKLEIGDQCFSDVMRQRQALVAITLSANEEFSLMPVHVIELQPSDFCDA